MGKHRHTENRRHGPSDRHTGARTHAAPNARQPGKPADQVWLYGHHAVSAALANPERRILRAVATPEAFEKLAAQTDIPKSVLQSLQKAGRKEIDDLVGPDAVHQGIAALTRPLSIAVEDLLDRLAHIEQAAIVVLDQVSDPHNVGAIVRSAAALGAAAVLVTERNAPSETGALAKAASGALDRIAYVHVVNVARTLELLKQRGFWIVGLAGDGAQTLSSVDLKARVALVLGTEGQGLRRLVRETCDHVARLPIEDAMESLNVSNAAAIALYERARQIGRA